MEKPVFFTIFTKYHSRRSMGKLLLFCVLLLAFVKRSDAQVQLSEQLIGSAYVSGTVGAVNVFSSVGEVVIATSGNPQIILTQGFHQPVTSGIMALSTESSYTDATCQISADGIGVIKVNGGVPPFTFQWSNGSINDTASFLTAGVYWVTTTAANGLTKTDTVRIGYKVEACNLKPYSGFTPNGDGHNDIWEIDGIEVFPENHVEVFDRWGTRMWFAKNYDNADNAWRGTTKNGNKIPEGSYFYIIKTSAETLKGWIELSR